MRFAVIAAAAATAGVASAHYGHDDEPQGYPEKGNGTAPVYTTEVVTAFTTYCPEATTLTHGPETYTVSEATTLTITNCPGGCTVTKPVTSSVVTVCPTCSTAGPIETTKSEMPPAYTSATEEGPKETTSEMAPTAYPTTGAETTYTYPILSSTEISPVPLPSPTSVSINGTIPATGTGSPVTSGTSTGSPIASYTGAANKAYSAAGAGFLAIFGLVAAL